MWSIEEREMYSTYTVCIFQRDTGTWGPELELSAVQSWPAGRFGKHVTEILQVCGLCSSGNAGSAGLLMCERQRAKGGLPGLSLFYIVGFIYAPWSQISPSFA